jgi:2-oxoisovalerate dehydrogenase E1 component alpha subunit
MRTASVDGNDAVASYLALQDAFAYVRSERKPFLMEAMVSRLYGHSSASGANFVPGEVDCIANFEELLETHGILTRAAMAQVRERWTKEIGELARQVRDEPMPTGESIWNNVYKERS